ncbi:MAG: nucleotidyltransferase domain-containing protein [Chloroflexi bacterium]|nr:nucleotidyltransferase domain-containing protein [Chloroflexota bacterium]
MGDRETATPRWLSTSFWNSSKRGPWPRTVLERLVSALDTLAQRLRGDDAVVGIILLGSYARGEFGRSSDVDILILFEGEERPELADTGRAALRVVGEVEAEARLPMHLAPLLASVDRPGDLGPDLIHALWADGIILYARAGALARFQPPGLAPWTLIRFSVARARPAERVRLSRRLHGARGRPGILALPALVLGPGAILVPGSQQQAVRAALDEAGATYDLIPVWREG